MWLCLVSLLLLLVTMVPAAADERDTRTCPVLFGSRVPMASAIHPDGDAKDMCPNDTGIPWTIHSVACKANTGTLRILPILTDKAPTSILKQPLACGVGRWTKGLINGAPVVRSFSSAGDLCTTTPCSIDLNIESNNGSQYAVVKIVGRFPPRAAVRKKGR